MFPALYWDSPQRAVTRTGGRRQTVHFTKLNRAEEAICILNMTICASSVKIQSYIFEQKKSKAFLAGWDISTCFRALLLSSFHLQPQAILNAKGKHGDACESKLLNKICSNNTITHARLLQGQGPKQGITSSFTFSPNLTCHANGTGGKTKPKKPPSPSLTPNYQTICSFKEILASTAQHLHPITI